MARSVSRRNFRDGVADERTAVFRRRAGGLRHERRLVAAAQEIHRARALEIEVGQARDTQLEMEVTVEHQRKRAAAHVVKKPFFDPERKRGKKRDP